MKTIETINNLFIKKVHQLKKKPNIYHRKEFLIEGRNNIEAALKHDALKTLFVTDENDSFEFENSFLVPQMIIDKLKQTKTNESMIGVSKFPKTYYQDYFEKRWTNLLILDNINDPGNMGTLIRSAVAFSFDAILVINNSVDVFNQKTIASSQGTIFDIPIIKVSDWNEFKKQLKNYQFYLFYLDNKSKSLSDIKTFKSSNALVLGNEARGLNLENYLDLNSETVYIKISNKIESLNVANAGSVALFYFDLLNSSKN